VGIAGRLPPLFRHWTHLGLHRLVSIAAGIFLGSIFLHLLPELAGGSHVGGEPIAAEQQGAASILPWCAVLAGFLLLFATERVWLQGRFESRREDAHTVLLSATFVGLALHSITFGLALGGIVERLSRDWPLFLSLLIHKAAETFSLGVVMSLARIPLARALLLSLAFAAIEPAGILFGASLHTRENGLEPIFTGFACGTFLYVAVCDLLPEVFHDTVHGWGKLGWLLLGILITAISLPGTEGLPALLHAVLDSSLEVFVEMSPFLLLGFAIAGWLGQVLKPETLTRHLSGDDLRSVVKASILGAPLPLCSCSVIPLALALRKKGASKGATSAFLIATPETGVDSVAVTWALLGPLMAILRPLGALLSAIFTGAAVNAVVRRERAAAQKSLPATPEHEACCADEQVPESSARGGLLERTLRFAFVDLLDDLAAALLMGILISGLIGALLPPDFFAESHLQGFPALLLMLVVGIPVYVCAAASTPIAASLILKGLSPGAARLPRPGHESRLALALGQVLGCVPSCTCSRFAHARPGGRRARSARPARSRSCGAVHEPCRQVSRARVRRLARVVLAKHFRGQRRALTLTDLLRLLADADQVHASNRGVVPASGRAGPRGSRCLPPS
jgi:uncharacterized membrane protein YraQ (UPF0718 family)/zinc transporter ZupT